MVRQLHGGDLDAAIGRFGGEPSDWLDLSTGINPAAWPVSEISAAAWARLPGRGSLERLIEAARRFHGVHAGNGLAAASGAQQLIQILPALAERGSAGYLHPTYNEYRNRFEMAGFTVEAVERLNDLAGLQLAAVVNPNNPDGQRHDPDELLDLAGRVGLLIVDEAFCEVTPELSLCGRELPENIVVLRSFGKFFGLAGVRLGFAVSGAQTADGIADRLGPWPVSGPALEIGAGAMDDAKWIDATQRRLAADMIRLRRMLDSAGFGVVGGTDLFVTVRCPDAAQWFERLGVARILVRRFPERPDWLRFGLPFAEAGWDRLSRTLKDG